MLLAGVNLLTVQRVMRHSSIDLTARVYAHLLPDSAAQAVCAVDTLFSSPASVKLA